jgi:hypothetical protein
MFRYLLLLEQHPSKSMHVDTLRIVDLYFMFPYLLRDFEFPRGAGKAGRVLAGESSKYNRLPSPRLFLHQLRGLSSIALTSLAGRTLLNPERLKAETAERTASTIPVDLFASVTASEMALAEFLSTNIATISLSGRDGLKKRSGLMEFRYDAA